MGIPGLHLTGRLELTDAKLSRTDVRDWLARAAVWFETVGDSVLDAELGQCEDGNHVLFVTLHPAADDLELRLSPEGTLHAAALTFPAGPGYHAHLTGMLAAFAADFDLKWTQVQDPTGFFLNPDVAALERSFLDCLARKCRNLANEAAEWADEPMPLGLPADHGFTHRGPVLTPTGPRSIHWLNAVAADPKAGREFFPWWSPDLDAAFYRNRAVTLLWCEYPWRPPLTDDEAELTDQIAADLATALSMDRYAAMPWREWAEVIDAIDADGHQLTIEPIDDELRAKVLKKAASLDPAAPRIGYRRLPVRVSVGGGWSVEIPGSFTDEWNEEGHVWTAWDGSRRIAVCLGCPKAKPDETGFVACGQGIWCRVEGGDQNWAEAIRNSIRCEAA